MKLETTRKRPAPKTRSRSSHMPRLDTIQMVEEVISKAREFDSKNRLWRALPRQVQYKTFTTILGYLEKSNKIMYDKHGAIMWLSAENNPKLMKLHRMSTILR